MIYFILALDGSHHIKIGTTIRLTERLKQLAAIRKTDLRVLGVMDGGYAEEQALHTKFESHWIYGEWFVSNPEIADFIAMESRPWDGKDEVLDSGQKPMVVQIRGSREYKEWAEELARTDGSTLAALYDRAVRRYAKELGFPKVPPRR